MKKNIPTKAGILRPKISLKVPYISCPKAKAIKKLAILSWVKKELV